MRRDRLRTALLVALWAAFPGTVSAQSLTAGERFASVAGAFLMLVIVGAGLVTFAKPALETVSDTVVHSLGRAFAVGLLAEILVLPTLLLVTAGLVLTVVGALLVPFVVVAGVLVVVAALLLGLLSMTHAMGEVITRRRMARGVALSPNSYRYLVLGIGGLVAAWMVWVAFGWVPVAGTLVLVTATIVTWFVTTVGVGATLLSRGGLRAEFAGRLLPAEAFTDEYLWATPQLGVPAVRHPRRSEPASP
jgi:hypothetical protein